MNFQDFIENGKVRKTTPDKLMIKSIINNTEIKKLIKDIRITYLTKNDKP